MASGLVQKRRMRRYPYGERNMMNQVESIYLGFWAAVTGSVCGSFVLYDGENL